MNKFEKYALILIGSSIFLFIFIIFSSNEIKTGENHNFTHNSAIEIDENLSKSNKKLEAVYTKNFKDISLEYQATLDKLSENIKVEDLQTIKQDNADIENIRTKFSKITVPKKYKSVHLLFSRSLLKLSTYLNSNNPEDMLAGIKLFEQAMTDYDKLSIS